MIPMVNTRSTSTNLPSEPQNTRPSSPNPPPDPIANQLATIASRLETLDSLAAKNSFKPNIAATHTPPKEGSGTTPAASTAINCISPTIQLCQWDADRQARFAKGLCFSCNEKFGPGHRCKTVTFALLEANPDNDEATLVEEEPEEDVNPNLSEFAAISLHTILGKQTATTMKLKGKLGKRDVLILMDSGSTHNFVSESIVWELHLMMQYVTPFGIQIGNGDIIRCNSICRNLNVQLPRLKITQDFFPFSIEGADLVLGIQWLASLNIVQANWHEMFLTFTIDGQKKREQGVDSFSRRPRQIDLFTLVMPVALDLIDLQKALKVDPHTRTIMETLQSDPKAVSHFSISGHKLYFKDRLVIPADDTLHGKILFESHDTPASGHGGYLKTLKRVSKSFYWPNLKQEVKQLSKYAHFIPLAHLFIAKKVAEHFCKEVVRLHGIPRSIVSDRDMVFLSNFWQELFKLCKTKLKMSTSYHPQIDGQTEVVNKGLEAYLRCFVQDQPLAWSSYLSWAEYSYNTGNHTSTNTTPFSMVYGRSPPPLYPYVPGEIMIADLDQQLIERDQMLRLLNDNLLKMQAQMKA
ncbi:Transposon Tf2-1 polyprotein [Quillaja saponaria]|uniref:Transposon Tf2-1 polyprotein n=1 Tax=Quillaja saponaria TaxID=32244 RepID=A0AAD7KX13_QUISA|nr:Transposon Tf2-1 polyprotein [Quillaja saponaria]